MKYQSEASKLLIKDMNLSQIDSVNINIHQIFVFKVG